MSPEIKTSPNAIVASLVGIATLAGSALLLAGSCGDTCEEGATEKNGPMCCSDGCGNRASVPLPRICKKGAWICESSGVLEQYCAYPSAGCNTPRQACTGTPIEPNPVAELCCELTCEGKKVARRVCQGGLNFGCPGGYVPISRCPDPLSACGGALQTYRKNGHTL